MKELHEYVANRLIENIRLERMQDLDDEILRIPAWHFSDPDRLADEIEVLRTLPMVVAHSSDLPEIGSFLTRDVLATPVLVTRRSDGTVAAYRNMCRHRGGKVELADNGSKRNFMCTYHGWTFDREDGALRNVPYAETFGDIDRGCLGLIPIQAEERHGLIWLDLSNDASRTVADFLGPETDEQLGACELERCVTFLNETFTLNVNWKLVMDGSADMLHLKFLHANGVGKMLVTARAVFLKHGPHGQSFNPRRRLIDLAERPADDAGDAEAVDAAVARMWSYVSSSVRLYPHTMCIRAPDHFEFWTVWPVVGDPSRTEVNIRFYVLPDILTDDMSERVQRSWDILKQAGFDEDFPMEETIQRNAVANPDREFIYGRNELSIRHLHNTLGADIARLHAQRVPR